MAFLTAEAIPYDSLACQVVGKVDLQAHDLTDTLLTPIHLQLEVTVVEGDLGERHRRAFTQYKGLVLASPCLVVIMYLTSQGFCLRRAEVVCHRCLAQVLIPPRIVQLARFRAVYRHQAIYKVIVALGDSGIIRPCVVVVDGKKEVERVVIDLSRLLIAELPADQALVALGVELS